MKDGYTMAIGGLMRTQTTKGGTKVPVLGSIPLLGRLFSSDTTDEEITNLIIFITAKAINAEGASPEEIINPNQLRGLGLRRDELPGYRDALGSIPPGHARRQGRPDEMRPEGARYGVPVSREFLGASGGCALFVGAAEARG